MLTTPDWQESDEWNLHASKRSQGIPRGVADIKSRAIPSHADQNKCMQWQQICNEDVSTPCRHHVPVKQRGQRAPEYRPVLDRFNPKEKSEDQKEDCYGLIIVTSSYGTRDISWSDSHESCSKETCRGGSNHFRS